MHIIKAINNEDLVYKCATKLDAEGDVKLSSNSNVNSDNTKYLNRVLMEIMHPRDRWIGIPNRNNSSIAACAETLWVLAGRSDLEFLNRFLPRAKNFSDDGKSWRGAYGERLYSHGQLDSVVNRLKENNNTRQAYLTLYDPNRDTDLNIQKEIGTTKTKDFICNVSLMFSIENNKLNLTVTNRSNDLIWGLGTINNIEFTIIQELVAEMVGVKLGKYYVLSNNLHYYLNDVAKRSFKTYLNHSPEANSNQHLGLGTDKTAEQIQKFCNNIVSTIMEGSNNMSKILDMLVEFGVTHNGLFHDMVMASYTKYNNLFCDVRLINDQGLTKAILLSNLDAKVFKRYEY